MNRRRPATKIELHVSHTERLAATRGDSLQLDPPENAPAAKSQVNYVNDFADFSFIKIFMN